MDLGTRVKNMLTTPRTEWVVVAAEPWTVADLYKSYIMPLAAIPVVAGLLHGWIFGYFGMRPGFFHSIFTALVTYVLSLAGVYVLGLIFSRLAPMFGGQQDDLAGLKLTAFGATASWVGGAFRLIPFVGWLVSLVLSLYSLYILYLGAPILMRIPPDRAVPYTVAVIVAAILISIVIGLIVGLIFTTPLAY